MAAGDGRKPGPWGAGRNTNGAGRSKGSNESPRGGNKSSSTNGSNKGTGSEGFGAIDDLFENLKNKIGGGGGFDSGAGKGEGGGWSGGFSFKMVLLGCVAVAVIWLGSGIYVVSPGEQGVELVFGKYRTTAGPGLNYNLPGPVGETIVLKVEQVQKIDIGFRLDPFSERKRDIADESLMLTGDENIIDIDFTVLWRISNAYDYLFKLYDPDSTIKRVAESAIRQVIGQTEIQPALNEARSKIESDTREAMQSILDEYGAGVTITEVQLLDVDPPNQVVDAFLDVQRAAADRERLRNEAEAYRNQIIPEARGTSVKLSQEAKAYKEQVVNDAVGDASRFNSVYQSWKVAQTVTTRRMYLETMEDVLSLSNKVILDGDGGAENVVPYLPLNQLKR